MKPFKRKLLIACLLLFGMSPGCFAQGGITNQTCNTAILMSNPNNFSGDFLNGGLVSAPNIPNCLSPNQNQPLHELWYKFTTDSISVYYLYCTGIVGAMEVYTGSCNDLSLVSCITTDESTAYSELLPSSAQTYYVRLVGYAVPNFSTYMLNYNYVDYTPTCALNIENIEMYPCMNSDGLIPVSLSGSLTDIGPLYGDVFVEIETDENLFFTSDIQTSNTWTANLMISGSQILHIYAIYGSSENACMDVVSNLPLSTGVCAESCSLTGTLNWNQHCGQRNGEVWFYDPNTDQLRAHYDMVIQGNGEFTIDYPMLGVFDVLVEVEGYLIKGFQDVSVQNTANAMECGSLIGGDFNGDNTINFIDYSILNSWFGQAPPQDFPAIDQSCDGFINFNDFSIINSGFGINGAVVPL